MPRPTTEALERWAPEQTRRQSRRGGPRPAQKPKEKK